MALSDQDEPIRKRPRLEDAENPPKVTLKSLPPEVRLMIWEYTWPAAQVVEAASRSNSDDDDEYHEYTIFRPVSSLDSLLRTNFSTRPLEVSSPLEKCPYPIALQICHESRLHTLKTYALVQHPDLPECAFYFNPRQDLLWLSGDISSDTERLEELRASYQTFLNQFRILLVEESEWGSWDWDPSSSPALSILSALRIVVLIDDDEDEDDTLITHHTEEYQGYATECQNDYYMFCKSKHPSTSYQLEYLDRGGNSYLVHTKRLEAGLRDPPESLLEATNPAAPLTPPDDRRGSYRLLSTDKKRVYSDFQGLTSPRKKKRSEKKKPNKKLEPASRSAVDDQRSELDSATTKPSAALQNREVIEICPPRIATPTSVILPASDGHAGRTESDDIGQSHCTPVVTIQPPAPLLQVAGLNLDSAALIMPSLLYKCVKMKSTIGIYGHRTTNIIATNETEKIREYATEISQYDYMEAIRAIKKDKAMYAGKGLQINYTETIYWDIIMKGAKLINPATLPVVKGPPDEFTMAEKVATKKFMCEAGYASGLENQRQYRKLWKSLFEMRKAGIDKILFYRSKEFDKYCKEYPRKSEYTLLDTITSWEKVYGPQIDQLETRVKHLVRGDAKGLSVLSLPHVEEKIKIQPASWNNATNVWFSGKEETAFKLAGGTMVAADDPVWGLFDHQALSESKHNKTLFITLLPKNEHNLAVCPIVPVYPGDFLGTFAGTIRFSDDFNRVHGIHGPMEKLWLDYSKVTGVLNQMKVSKPGGEANVQIRWELVNIEEEGEPRISYTVSVRALKPIKPFEEVVREAPQEEQYLFHQSAAHASQGFLKAIS
ncbi:Vacuolar protein sorting-associated protein 3 [Talaromyces islandicus]|uniref:Vacuolar protein sorting-associated protein 3 n=1 Tax=Talaromyces islandicus TaxID=28573 RepID=A0A0U1M673_TALIS|nr:Vacuolar protein sorting-associated protein 3 [Talaromyces islandicus]